MGKLSELSLSVTSASGLSVSGPPLAGANLYLNPPDHNRSPELHEALDARHGGAALFIASGLTET